MASLPQIYLILTPSSSRFSVDVKQPRHIRISVASCQLCKVGTLVADRKPGEEPEILSGMGDMEGKHSARFPYPPLFWELMPRYYP